MEIISVLADSPLKINLAFLEEMPDVAPPPTIDKIERPSFNPICTLGRNTLDPREFAAISGS